MKPLNRRQSIRARCIDCSGGSRIDVRECPITDCPLWPFRMGSGKQDFRARGKAIRDYCKECANGQRVEVKLCPSGGCPLFRFRPYQKDAGNVKKRNIEVVSQKKTRAEGKG